MIGKVLRTQTEFKNREAERVVLINRTVYVVLYDKTRGLVVLKYSCLR